MPVVNVWLPIIFIKLLSTYNLFVKSALLLTVAVHFGKLVKVLIPLVKLWSPEIVTYKEDAVDNAFVT